MKTHEHVGQVRLKAEARETFFAEVPVRSSGEVAQLLGSSPDHLVRDAKLFAVSREKEMLFPSFQFVGNRVHSAIAEVLRAFKNESSWTVALWFNSPSGWLGGQRPLALFGDEPERVVDAARKTASPIEI